jgi:UDP-N-acetylglucosamine 3-dehydrogenase
MSSVANPLPLAIIGAGRMGTLYGQIANELVQAQLVALCGETAESTRAAAEKLNVPGYASGRWQEMLERHPEIEAVVVATPEWIHREPVIDALNSGRHVLVEKPLAVSPTDAWHMADTARSSGKVLTVCHSQRFNPRFALMREAVVSGDIGKVMHVYARRHSLQPAVNRVLGHFPLPYWLAPHDIDMMLWTVGAPVKAVNAWSGDGGASRTDFIGASLRFANGVVGVLEASWCTPGSGGRPLNELFTVRGDAGSVEVIGHEQGLAIYRGDGTVRFPDTYHSPVINGQTDGYYRSLLRHFIGAVRGLWPVCITAEEAAAVIDVACAIQVSIESGREAPVAGRTDPVVSHV